jgi:hypothetical protein
MDTRKQNNFLKILELVRLKSSLVKLAESGAQQLDKYKQNIKTCIHLVKYLQHLIDSLNKPATKEASSTNMLSHGFLSASSELIFTPKQKLYYLNRYKNAYWSCIYKQLIKLKQLSSINEQSVDLDYSNASEVTLASYEANTAQIVKPEEASSMNIKNFFDYYEPFEMESGADKENGSRGKNKFEYDSLIQTGLLSLILSSLKTGGDEQSDLTSSEESLNEAIGLFNQMNKSLDDVSKEQLSNYQLKVSYCLFYKKLNILIGFSFILEKNFDL